MVAAGVGVLLVAAAIIGRTAPWEQGGAARSRPSQDGHVGAPPLPGVPLRSPAGLRLLVANDPEPFVLDVDSGVIQPVIGLPADDDRSVHVESVGEDAVVVSRRDCRGSGCDPDSVVYLVRHGSTVATRLGAASDVESSRDGRGVWLLARQDSTHCTLGQVGLDGQPRRPTRPVPASRPSSTSSLPGCSSMSVGRATALAPTARWSPPMAPSAGSPRWWTAWPAETGC
jgi:hypothetical protein